MIATHITTNSCSVITQNGEKVHRKAYENSEQGRAEFLTECADCENLEDVLMAWGDVPTVFYTPDDDYEETPTPEERIAALEAQNTLLSEELAATKILLGLEV